jgi:hypothetical protein
MSWKDDVKQGRDLMKAVSQHQWGLAALADKVDKEYGPDGLWRFAQEIKCDLNTLKAYRATWRAWQRGESNDHNP